EIILIVYEVSESLANQRMIVYYKHSTLACGRSRKSRIHRSCLINMTQSSQLGMSQSSHSGHFSEHRVLYCFPHSVKSLASLLRHPAVACLCLVRPPLWCRG